MPSAVGVGYEVERMQYQVDKDRFIHLAKKLYEKIMKDKRINITGMQFVDSWVPKLVIDYEVPAKGRTFMAELKKGRFELNDIGPRPQKPKPERKPKKEPKATKTKGTKPLHTKLNGGSENDECRREESSNRKSKNELYTPCHTESIRTGWRS